MPFDRTGATAVLERTPRVLTTLLAGLPDGWIRGTEGPDTWSPFDVVGHLINGEERDWMDRIRLILAQGEDRRFEPFDRFRHLEENRGRTMDELLERFAELRRKNLDELRGMEIDDGMLRLRGTHPALGEVSLEQLLATWVAHDLGHISQIARVMAKQYRDAVGPWEAYLSVLHR